MTDKNEKQSESEEETKKCFIIMPVGKDNTITQEKSFGLLESVIKPVLCKMNIECVAPREITKTGAISKQIIEEIVNDSLVIANLTGLNPNVMYEVGIRHSIAKPIVTLCEEGTSLPFDISDQRNIFYKDSFSGLGKAIEDLTSFLLNVKDKVDDKDNPVYSATKTIVNPNDNNIQIVDAIEQVTDDMSSLKTEFSNFKNSYKNNISGAIGSLTTPNDYDFTNNDYLSKYLSNSNLTLRNSDFQIKDGQIFTDDESN